MRIVVDFQAAQTGSRYRGIGHYSTELMKSLIRHSPGDEIYLVLNGAFRDSIEPIRAEFDGILPQENIRVWYAPGPIEHFGNASGNLREVAEALREYFLRSLEPDLILIASVFEGLHDGAVISANKFVTDVPVAAVFYDFTPLYMPDEQFQTNSVYRNWYRERIDVLRQCDLLLAISESSRQELLDQLDFPTNQVVNIFGGRTEAFTRRTYQRGVRERILRDFGITKPFILYAGGIEPNKNLKALVEALSMLPEELIDKHEFVCVGKRSPGEIERIQGFARDIAAQEMIRIVDFVSQTQLVDLYNLCSIFVFPSLREGFGLPPLEAMSCGAPTIVSDRTSLPEVVANPDALFDPTSPSSIASKMTEVLTDRQLRSSLVEKGLERASELTWNATGSKAAAEMRKRFSARKYLDRSRRTVVSRTQLFKPNRKRILVQKLDHHGDFLLALPAIAKLRSRYPDARIDALVGSWNRAAAEASNLFDEIHGLDFFKAQSSVSARLDSDEFDNLSKKLPFYDYAIDLRRQSDTRFVLVKLNAHAYFGYRTGDERIDSLLTAPLQIHPDAGGERSYFDETHTCSQMLRIVDTLPFDANDYVQLPSLGKKLETKPGSVAIFPRVGNDSRQWDSEYFAALIQALASRDDVTEIGLFCGRPAELDCIDFKPNPKIRVHAGLSFDDLFSALSSHLVCVGNNSFGVHLAGYAGCRTIGIYSGHELPQQWGPPFGESLAISVDAACSPCHLPDRQSCPHDLFCLGDISVRTVEAAVVESLAGKPIPEEYTRITRNNPASAIKPLVDAVNKGKFLGRIDGLSPEQRLAFAAAVSVNFPERVSTRRCIYLDVSGLLESSLAGKSNGRLKDVRQTIEMLQAEADASLVPIAAGQHDHEFYFVNVDRLEESLFSGDRSQRVVRPVAGDTYVGLHCFTHRNPAQWQLLTTWRQMGVLTIFHAPRLLNLPSSHGGDEASQPATYLFTIAHFDAIIARHEDCERLRKWVDECGPPRLRELVCTADLADLLKGCAQKRAQDRVARARLVRGEDRDRTAGFDPQFLEHPAERPDSAIDFRRNVQ